jgi:hypothetical protein
MEDLLSILDEATRIRMISEVPLGAFLSGGGWTHAPGLRSFPADPHSFDYAAFLISIFTVCCPGLNQSE